MWFYFDVNKGVNGHTNVRLGDLKHHSDRNENKKKQGDLSVRIKKYLISKSPCR